MGNAGEWLPPTTNPPPLCMHRYNIEQVLVDLQGGGECREHVGWMSRVERALWTELPPLLYLSSLHLGMPNNS